MSFNYAPSGGGTQPVATGSSVASAPVNLAFAQIGGAFNNHITGAQYPHALIAGGGGVNVSQTLNGVTAASASVTDLWTMLDRLANAIGVINLGSSAAGSWANLAGIPASQGVGNATANATANALVRRGASAEASFGQLNSGAHFATSPAAGTQAGQFRGAAGDPTQSILAATNNAGTILRWYADNVGNTVQTGGATAATLVATGIIYAGSATTQVTDSVGLVRTAALPVVDAAHGGLGVDLTVTGNKPTARALLVAAASGVNADITSLTGLTTPLPPSEGGTGLISPAAGNLPVTNGAGAYSLLSPAGVNYFVTSNGSTFVATAFNTNLIPSGTLAQSVMSPLFAAPATGGGNALKVTVNAWNGYVGGSWIEFAGGNSPAIDPTGIGVGQSRIDLLTLTTGGVLAWSVGTPSTTPSIPATVVPSNVATIWYAKTYQSATSITGYTDTGTNAALIRDARNAFGPISAVTGTTGAPSNLHFATMADDTAFAPNSKNIANKSVVTYAPDADFPNRVNLAVLLNGQYLNSGNVVNGYTPGLQTIDPRLLQQNTDANQSPASPLDILGFSIQQDIPQRLSVASNGASSTASISAGTGGIRVTATKHSITLYGAAGLRTRTIATTLTSPAIGAQAAGVLYLCADLNTPNVSTYTLFWSTSAALAQYQCVLAEMFYDGSTTLYWRSSGGNYVVEEYGGLGTVDAQRVRMNRINLTSFAVDTAASINNAVYAVPANCPRINFEIMEPKFLLATWRATVTIGNNCTSGQKIYMGIAIDDDGAVVGNQYAPAEYTIPTFTGVSVTGYGAEIVLNGMDIIPLAPSSNAGGASARVHSLALYNLSTLTSVSVFGRVANLIPFAQ